MVILQMKTVLCREVSSSGSVLSWRFYCIRRGVLFVHGKSCYTYVVVVVVSKEESQMSPCISNTAAAISTILLFIGKWVPLPYFVSSLYQLTHSIVQLQLPVEVPVCVILSSMVTAGHFFLQQPTHPSHPSLAHLNRQMLAFYSHMDTPLLPVPLPAPGAICAAPVISGWFRAQVVSAVDEDTQECDIKFLDYGGYIRIHISMLRQIWSDFMVLPFQATECYLADVVPNTEDGLWSAKACEVFEELAQGQILQAVVVGFAEDGVPCVELHKVQGETNVFINKELVDLNLAQWASTSP
ncbi:AKAP1 [Cordylochernes scorpioides]|uniref:AKAP1 n=1 Tax=Cordylochernes scorpioides TaxID=51811 RepID=A0ABY6L2Q6_9ARAC|nr:AKAP1 [Cordylochernes scorpioides]